MPHPPRSAYPRPWPGGPPEKWHFHVLCRSCVPGRRDARPPRLIPDMAAAQDVKRAFNAAIARIGHRHRYVVEGCADVTCEQARSAPTYAPDNGAGATA